jgi:hypothetical protein
MKTSLSSPKPTFKIRNTHTYFCRPSPPEQADSGAGLTPINIISLVVGITPRHPENFCGAHLRVWKIPRMTGRLMRSRLIPTARTASLARTLAGKCRCLGRGERMNGGTPGGVACQEIVSQIIDPAGHGPRPARPHRCGSTGQMEMACPQAALWTTEDGCFPFSQFLESNLIDRTKGIAYAFFNLACN